MGGYREGMHKQSNGNHYRESIFIIHSHLVHRVSIHSSSGKHTEERPKSRGYYIRLPLNERLPRMRAGKSSSSRIPKYLAYRDINDVHRNGIWFNILIKQRGTGGRAKLYSNEFQSYYLHFQWVGGLFGIEIEVTPTKLTIQIELSVCSKSSAIWYWYWYPTIHIFSQSSGKRLSSSPPAVAFWCRTTFIFHCA